MANTELLCHYCGTHQRCAPGTNPRCARCGGELVREQEPLRYPTNHKQPPKCIPHYVIVPGLGDW